MGQLVAGVDSSTQSCKVIIYDPESGNIVRSGSAGHPRGTEVSADAWWQAFCEASGKAGGLGDVDAISVGGQQHGMVTLDTDGNLVRDALLWNDTRSATAASKLTEELGAQVWAEACGSVPVASLTVSKVRWMADNEPESLRRTAAICLPHDYLSWRISGSSDISSLTTDRSDASGTGYLDLRTAEYHDDLFAYALRVSRDEAQRIYRPRVVAPFEAAAEVMRSIEEIGLKAGTIIGAGCGDNAGAALGLGLKTGEASMSLGTSGAVAVVSDQPVWDRTGVVTGFMDATGNWLPLACTLNGAPVISRTADLLGVDFDRFDDLALSVSDSAGLELVPYFEGERTPNLPNATASLSGITFENWDPEHIAHVAVQSLAELMVGAVQAVSRCGTPVTRVSLIGGGARSRAVQHIFPEVLGIDVDFPAPAEYVALGAAKQAAHLL
ncbi:MAG: FGGY family carbohydrate kinase [Actinomycetaceae bacterium]|nr:FGGY family carbohydrate kinase [Actinomycetaceae bacterium]